MDVLAFVGIMFAVMLAWYAILGRNIGWFFYHERWRWPWQK